MALSLDDGLDFNVPVLQMAMKRYRQGGEYKSTLHFPCDDREYSYRGYSIENEEIRSG
jgi:hypothetical protein